jgi:cell division protein FtsB
MWVVVVGAVAAAVLFLGLFPTRQYLDQRREIESMRAEVGATEDEVEALETRIADLADPATVERLARERFGVVRPGEEAYRVFFLPDGAGSAASGSIFEP